MKIAFYAPMKPPTHPTPSGDRRMARLLMEALDLAGYDVTLASELRTYDGRGDADKQSALIEAAATEAARLTAQDPPDLWFTYHCYYKAPDLIGPVVAKHFGIPYMIAEASRAKKRLDGPWSAFASKAEAAIDTATILFAMSPEDRFALDRDKTPIQQIVDLRPFLDPGFHPGTIDRETAYPINLLTVAMMREGAKLESYRRLAAALQCLEIDWHLTIVGDGPAREAVSELFTPFNRRIDFKGEVGDPDELRMMYEAADLFVWPGVEEAYGMVYLESQAAGTPVVAEAHPGPTSVIGYMDSLVSPETPHLFAAAIKSLATRPRIRQTVRAHVLHNHGITSAAKTLRQIIGHIT